MSHTELNDGEHGPRVDHEINTRAVVWSIVGVALTTAVSMVLMVWMMNAMLDTEAADDPPPSPLVQANVPWEPPGPALQEYPPVTDIETFRAHQEAWATSYGWVDEEAEVVRIPVEEALRVLEERGFPEGGDVEALSAELFGAVAPAVDGGGGA